MEVTYQEAGRNMRRQQQTADEEAPPTPSSPTAADKYPIPHMSPPLRNVRFSSGTKQTEPESPGLHTVGSSDTATGSTMTINHSFSSSGAGGGSKNSRAAAAGTIFGMSKPVAAIVAMVLMGTMGAGMWGWLTIPGLNAQIKELEAQVDELKFEVDRLGIQVNLLETQVGKLETENNRYELLNNELNSTVLDLQQVNDDLAETTLELEGAVDGLNITVADLEQVNQDLSAENQRYAGLNRELSTIVSFLNETSSQLDETFEDIVAYLAEQITGNRVLVLQTLQNSYNQLVLFWDCSFRDVFRGKPYVVDEDAVIDDSGGRELQSVLDYVDGRVLSELCLNATDFEAFLDSRYSLNSLSVNQLYQGAALYTDKAMEYYFPDLGESGLTRDEWAVAGYDCESIVSRFTFDG